MNITLVLTILALLSTRAIAQDKTLTDYGVEISFSGDKDIFPESWLTREIDAKAISLDSAEIERSKRIITKALNKYPVDLVKRNLTNVYVVKKIEYYGQDSGGANSTSQIYLTNNGIRDGYSDFWIEQSFHSEFSSILFRNYSFFFDKKKWTSNNKDVQYGQIGDEVLKSGIDITQFDFELNKVGILSEYGKASVEEDFNSFAGNLFLSSNGFWEIGESRKRIKKKTDQAIQFYSLMDKSFNEAYFRQVSKK
jgi:hypothetical protein